MLRFGRAAAVQAARGRGRPACAMQPLSKHVVAENSIMSLFTYNATIRTFAGQVKQGEHSLAKQSAGQPLAGSLPAKPSRRDGRGLLGQVGRAVRLGVVRRRAGAEHFDVAPVIVPVGASSSEKQRSEKRTKRGSRQW